MKVKETYIVKCNAKNLTQLFLCENGKWFINMCYYTPGNKIIVTEEITDKEAFEYMDK